jgi:RNA polymerase sigma-70 factor (ECF subfamily)
MENRSIPEENPPNTEAAPPAPERMDLFVQLLGQNQRRVYLYVVSMVPHRNDAEEILQETNLVLWREFGRFQPGTHFAAWACKVAFHQVLAWRKRKQRDRLQFSEAFLEAVGEEAANAVDLLEERSRALADCLDRLPAGQRDLIRWRYSDGLSIEEVSRQAGRTVEAAYRALSRIRQTLYDCVTHSLMQGAGP